MPGEAGRDAIALGARPRSSPRGDRPARGRGGGFMSEAQLLALTEDIYDAATGATPWAAVGRGLMRLVGAQSASLMAGDIAAGQADLLYHADIPLDAVLAYKAHYRTVDLWTNRAAQTALRASPETRPKVWTSGCMVPDNEFLRSEFYVDFGRRLGLRYVVGTVVPLGAAGLMPIGLHRPEGARPFDAMDAQLLERLLPHLRRALQLRHQLRAAAPCVLPEAAALDALSAAVLVVDAEMHVLVANRAAEAMTGVGSALRLVRASGGKRTIATGADRADHAGLCALVQATASGRSAGGGLRLRDGGGEAALAALVTPLPCRLLGASGGMGRVAGQAMILLRELAPAQEPPRAELLRTLFGLTPAEAEVACALAGGATKGTVAARRGSRVSTVRTQVRSVLEKTGTTTLRELEGLLSRLTA
jgi:PAS domain-containing protein/DNA-binding CsgD family transcriptional regulator